MSTFTTKSSVDLCCCWSSKEQQSRTKSRKLRLKAQKSEQVRSLRLMASTKAQYRDQNNQNMSNHKTSCQSSPSWTHQPVRIVIHKNQG
jgi:hypothetical protein